MFTHFACPPPICYPCSLLRQTDEIHVDILNAHLQFVTPFLKQHGVEYERDRFTEKLDAGDTSLEVTHRWLHRTILQLRSAAEGNTPSTLLPVSQTPGASAEMLFYRQLLTDLEQRKGDAYLKLLRVAIVDNLLASIVKVDRKPGASGASGGKPGSYETLGKGVGAGESGGMRDDQQEDMLEGVAIPETLGLDQYRLVVIAARAEQASYSASLVAFARQALAGARVPLNRADEDRMREALMVLFETEDVTSADICAQVYNASMCNCVFMWNQAGTSLLVRKISYLTLPLIYQSLNIHRISIASVI